MLGLDHAQRNGRSFSSLDETALYRGCTIIIMGSRKTGSRSFSVVHDCRYGCVLGSGSSFKSGPLWDTPLPCIATFLDNLLSTRDCMDSFDV